MENLGDQNPLCVESEARTPRPERRRCRAQPESGDGTCIQGVAGVDPAAVQGAASEAGVGEEQGAERAFAEPVEPAAERAARGARSRVRV